MSNERKPEEQRPATGGAQPVQNPFREPDAVRQEPSAEDDTAAEQQRKEALTERD